MASIDTTTTFDELFAWNYSAFNLLERTVNVCVDTLSTDAYDDSHNPNTSTPASHSERGLFPATIGFISSELPNRIDDCRSPHILFARTSSAPAKSGLLLTSLL